MKRCEGVNSAKGNTRDRKRMRTTFGCPLAVGTISMGFGGFIRCCLLVQDGKKTGGKHAFALSESKQGNSCCLDCPVADTVQQYQALAEATAKADGVRRKMLQKKIVAAAPMPLIVGRLSAGKKSRQVFRRMTPGRRAAETYATATFLVAYEQKLV